MKSLLTATLLLALAQCDRVSGPSPETQTIIIRTGTSFGMCVGYCFKDYTLTSGQLKLDERGFRAPDGPRSCQTTLPEAIWTTLTNKADFANFKKQPETLGCPDCADGGAEYVELQKGEEKHRVTFEYGKTIPGFGALVESLRVQRARLASCGS